MHLFEVEYKTVQEIVLFYVPICVYKIKGIKSHFNGIKVKIKAKDSIESYTVFCFIYSLTFSNA